VDQSPSGWPRAQLHDKRPGRAPQGATGSALSHGQALALPAWAIPLCIRRRQRRVVAGCLHWTRCLNEEARRSRRRPRGLEASQVMRPWILLGACRDRGQGGVHCVAKACWIDGAQDRAPSPRSGDGALPLSVPDGDPPPRPSLMAVCVAAVLSTSCWSDRALPPCLLLGHGRIGGPVELNLAAAVKWLLDGGVVVRLPLNWPPAARPWPWIVTPGGGLDGGEGCTAVLAH